MTQKLLNMAEVCKRTSLSRTAIHKHRVANNFPLPVKVSDFRIAFVEAEVDEWIQQRIDARGAA